MENRKKEKQEKNKQEYKAIFPFPFEEITYLSYCIRHNPLKEKELCAETWSFFFLLTSYCTTAIYQHQKNKDYDLQGSQQYQYQGLPELLGNPARHGKGKLRDVPQPLTGGQHAKFQGGL